MLTFQEVECIIPGLCRRLFKFHNIMLPVEGTEHKHVNVFYVRDGKHYKITDNSITFGDLPDQVMHTFAVRFELKI